MTKHKHDYRNIGNRKWWAIGAISLAAIAFGLDLTVLNLALPTLSTALHASTSQLEWIVAAYSLALSVMLLPAGLLGDRFGRKKVILFALTLFGVSSLACAYSTSAGQLIAARVALGIGGAFILPLGLSTLTVFFNDKERPKALGLLFGANFASFPLGPILGGWLLTHYWWGSVFLINIPVVIVAIIAIAILLPESRAHHKPKLDISGLVLASLGITSITYGAVEAEFKGWGSPEVLILLVLGAILLAWFYRVERWKMRHKHRPLVDLKLFDSKGFLWGAILTTGLSFAIFGLFFTIPQFFQSAEGKSALAAGYRLLPMVGGLIIGTVLATRLARTIGTKIPVALGFAAVAAGLIIGASTKLGSSDLFVITWIAIIGVGMGLVMPPAVNAALDALSPESSGVGSSVLQAMRQVGSTLGVAVLGSIVGASYRSQLHLQEFPHAVAVTIQGGVTAGVVVAEKLKLSTLLNDVRVAFVHSMDVLLIVCAGIAIVSVILTLIFLPNRPVVAKSQKNID